MTGRSDKYRLNMKRVWGVLVALSLLVALLLRWLDPW